MSRIFHIACMLLVLTGLACATTRSAAVALPTRHTIKSEPDQLILVSDVKLAKDHWLVEDLKSLRRQVYQELDLPASTKPVVVYLFPNKETYEKYLRVVFPGYPSRRAYFIQTPGKELAVYTWWGERIREDLRHEFTHGLLHASLEGVPLWLDEGLAEYFEVAGGPGRLNVGHARGLAAAVQNGWRPDLDQLESLEKVEQMQRPHYQEAWAWVHFMLNGSEDTRALLLEYLRELRTNGRPGPLHERLLAETPDADVRLLSYVASMGTPLGGDQGPIHRASMYR